LMETMTSFRYQNTNIVYRLLLPHFQRTLAVNHGARMLLIPWIKQHLTDFSSEEVDDMLNVNRFDAQTLFIDTQLKNRGITHPIEDYFFATDALEIWNTLFGFVKNVIVSHVVDWQQINLWMNNIRKHIPSCPTLDSNTQLARWITAVIFNASVMHSALNDPQWYFMGYSPNMPATLSKPILPPNTAFTSFQWKQYYLDSLPDMEVMQLQRDLVSILSLGEPPNSSFFQCLQDYRAFVSNDLLTQLTSDLLALECVKRPVYPWLHPFQMTRSVIR